MTDTLAVPARTPAVAAPARSRRSLRVAGMAMCAAALLAGCAETVNDNGVTRRQGTGAAHGEMDRCGRCNGMGRLAVRRGFEACGHERIDARQHPRLPVTEPSKPPASV